MELYLVNLNIFTIYIFFMMSIFLVNMKLYMYENMNVRCQNVCMIVKLLSSSILSHSMILHPSFHLIDTL